MAGSVSHDSGAVEPRRRGPRGQCRQGPRRLGRGQGGGRRDLVALSEMFITGYQVQDLVDETGVFVAAMQAEALAAELAARCADGPALGIGGPMPRASDLKLHNAYWVLQGGG